MAQPHIFINYRRSDTEGFAIALYGDLNQKYPGQIFMDRMTLEVGRKYESDIERSLQDCSILIVLIGPNWLSVQNKDGKRRLFESKDILRTEIAVALKRNIPVIPLLVGHVPMPARAELPEEIVELAEYNATHLYADDWSSSISRLCRTIDARLAEAATEAEKSRQASSAPPATPTPPPTPIAIVETAPGAAPAQSTVKAPVETPRMPAPSPDATPRSAPVSASPITSAPAANPNPPSPPAPKIELQRTPPRAKPAKDGSKAIGHFRVLGVFGAVGLLVMVLSIVYAVRKKSVSQKTTQTAQIVQPPRPFVPPKSQSSASGLLTSTGAVTSTALNGRIGSLSERGDALSDSAKTSWDKASGNTLSSTDLSEAIREFNKLAPSNATSSSAPERFGSSSKPSAKTSASANSKAAYDPYNEYYMSLNNSPSSKSTSPISPRTSTNLNGEVWADQASGLTWAVRDFNQLSSVPAGARRAMTRVSYAQTVLNLAYNQQHYGGFSDWRIPTKQEIETICGTNLARLVYQINFKSSPSFLYWTSTTDPLAVVMNCKTGKTGGVFVNDDLGHTSEPTTIPSIRPVRGHLH